MAERQAAGWSFSTLFMAKDSLARMYEAAHMLDDALREYSELEACYLEAMAAGSELASAAFGAMHGFIAGPRPYERADLVREVGCHGACILRAVKSISRMLPCGNMDPMHSGFPSLTPAHNAFAFFTKACKGVLHLLQNNPKVLAKMQPRMQPCVCVILLHELGRLTL